MNYRKGLPESLLAKKTPWWHVLRRLSFILLQRKVKQKKLIRGKEIAKALNNHPPFSRAAKYKACLIDYEVGWNDLIDGY